MTAVVNGLISNEAKSWADLLMPLLLHSTWNLRNLLTSGSKEDLTGKDAWAWEKCCQDYWLIKGDLKRKPELDLRPFMFPYDIERRAIFFFFMRGFFLLTSTLEILYLESSWKVTFKML